MKGTDKGKPMVAAPGELYSSAVDNILASAEQIYDYTKEKTQEEINTELYELAESSHQEIDTYSKEEIDEKLTSKSGEISAAYDSSVAHTDSEIQELNTTLREYIHGVEQGASGAINVVDEKVDSKVQEINNTINTLEQNRANELSEITDDYNSRATVKFDSIISQANILQQSTASDTVTVHYVSQNKTFVARPVGTVGTSVCYANWKGRELYCKEALANPYSEKVYICNGTCYIWNNNELQAIGGDVIIPTPGPSESTEIPTVTRGALNSLRSTDGGTYYTVTDTTNGVTYKIGNLFLFSNPSGVTQILFTNIKNFNTTEENYDLETVYTYVRTNSDSWTLKNITSKEIQDLIQGKNQESINNELNHLLSNYFNFDDGSLEISGNNISNSTISMNKLNEDLFQKMVLVEQLNDKLNEYESKISNIQSKLDSIVIPDNVFEEIPYEGFFITDSSGHVGACVAPAIVTNNETSIEIILNYGWNSEGSIPEGDIKWKSGKGQKLILNSDFSTSQLPAANNDYRIVIKVLDDSNSDLFKYQAKQTDEYSYSGTRLFFRAQLQKNKGTVVVYDNGVSDPTIYESGFVIKNNSIYSVEGEIISDSEKQYYYITDNYEATTSDLEYVIKDITNAYLEEGRDEYKCVRIKDTANNSKITLKITDKITNLSYEQSFYLTFQIQGLVSEKIIVSSQGGSTSNISLLNDNSTYIGQANIVGSNSLEIIFPENETLWSINPNLFGVSTDKDIIRFEKVSPALSWIYTNSIESSTSQKATIYFRYQYKDLYDNSIYWRIISKEVSIVKVNSSDNKNTSLIVVDSENQTAMNSLEEITKETTLLKVKNLSTNVVLESVSWEPDTTDVDITNDGQLTIHNSNAKELPISFKVSKSEVPTLTNDFETYHINLINNYIIPTSSFIEIRVLVNNNFEQIQNEKVYYNYVELAAYVNDSRLEGVVWDINLPKNSPGLTVDNERGIINYELPEGSQDDAIRTLNITVYSRENNSIRNTSSIKVGAKYNGTEILKSFKIIVDNVNIKESLNQITSSNIETTQLVYGEFGSEIKFKCKAWVYFNDGIDNNGRYVELPASQFDWSVVSYDTMNESIIYNSDNTSLNNSLLQSQQITIQTANHANANAANNPTLMQELRWTQLTTPDFESKTVADGSVHYRTIRRTGRLFIPPKFDDRLHKIKIQAVNIANPKLSAEFEFVTRFCGISNNTYRQWWPVDTSSYAYNKLIGFDSDGNYTNPGYEAGATDLYNYRSGVIQESDYPSYTQYISNKNGMGNYMVYTQEDVDRGYIIYQPITYKDASKRTIVIPGWIDEVSESDLNNFRRCKPISKNDFQLFGKTVEKSFVYENQEGPVSTFTSDIVTVNSNIQYNSERTHSIQTDCIGILPNGIICTNIQNFTSEYLTTNYPIRLTTGYNEKLVKWNTGNLSPGDGIFNIGEVKRGYNDLMTYSKFKLNTTNIYVSNGVYESDLIKAKKRVFFAGVEPIYNNANSIINIKGALDYYDCKNLTPDSSGYIIPDNSQLEGQVVDINKNQATWYKESDPNTKHDCKVTYFTIGNLYKVDGVEKEDLTAQKYCQCNSSGTEFKLLKSTYTNSSDPIPVGGTTGIKSITVNNEQGWLEIPVIASYVGQKNIVKGVGSIKIRRK